MAFVPGGSGVEDGEETIQDPNAPPIIPGVGGAAGAGGQGAGTGAMVPQEAQAQSPKEAGFTDVASYLSANRPQATAFAGDVADRLSQSAGELRGTVEQAGQQFGERVEQGTTRLDQDLLDRAVADPSAFAGQQEDFDALQGQRTAQFQSPGQFEEQEFFADTQREIKEGQRLGQLGESEAGRRELLYSLGQNPTAGQVELDQLLIGGTPGARSQIQDASKAFYGEIPDYLQQTGATAGQQLQEGKDITGQTRQSVQDRLAQSQSQLEDQIRAEVESQRGIATGRTDNARQLLDNLINIRPEDIGRFTGPSMPRFGPQRENPYDYLNIQTLNDIGLDATQLRQVQQDLDVLRYAGRYDPQSGRLSRTGSEQIGAFDQGYGRGYPTGPDIYNREWDLNQFMNPLSPEAQITAGNVATPDQFADYQALNQLGATTPDLLFPEQGDLAGTFDPNLTNVNAQDLLQRVGDMRTSRDEEAIKNAIYFVGTGQRPTTEENFRGWLGDPQNSAQSDWLAKAMYGHAVGAPENRAISQAGARAANRMNWWNPTAAQTQRYWSGPGQPGDRIGIPNPV